MSSARSSFSVWRASLVFGLVAWAGVGCKAAGEMVLEPVVTLPSAKPVLRVTPSPSAVPNPTAMPSAVASRPVAVVFPSPSLAPLATASLDSDLDSTDNAAIQALLDSDELLALLPSDLIHDGGVILYRLLGESSLDVRSQQDGAGRGAVPEVAVRVSPEPSPTAPGLSREPAEDSRGGVPQAPPEPEELDRSRQARSGAQVKIRKVPCPADLAGCRSGEVAEVVVRYVSRGVITLRARDGLPVQKRPYEEVFQRSLLVQRAADRKQWKLLSLGAIDLQSDGARPSASLQEVRLFAGDAAEPLFTQAVPFQPVRADAFPVVKAGLPLRIEAQLADPAAAGKGLAVFAHLVGVSDRAKVALRDDGKGADRLAKDGVYTTRFVLPPGAGVRTLGLEILDSTLFGAQNPGNLPSRTLGLSLRVQDKRPTAEAGSI